MSEKTTEAGVKINGYISILKASLRKIRRIFRGKLESEKRLEELRRKYEGEEGSNSEEESQPEGGSTAGSTVKKAKTKEEWIASLRAGKYIERDEKDLKIKALRFAYSLGEEGFSSYQIGQVFSQIAREIDEELESKLKASKEYEAYRREQELKRSK